MNRHEIPADAAGSWEVLVPSAPESSQLLYFTEHGSGPPLLLVHGSASPGPDDDRRRSTRSERPGRADRTAGPGATGRHLHRGSHTNADPPAASESTARSSTSRAAAYRAVSPLRPVVLKHGEPVRQPAARDPGDARSQNALTTRISAGRHLTGRAGVVFEEACSQIVVRSAD